MSKNRDSAIRILIMDDNPMALNEIRYLIRSAILGVEIDTADSFDQAKKMITEAHIKMQDYKFFVTDLAMGLDVNSGIMAVSDIAKTFPNTEIIAISGKNTRASDVFGAMAFAFYRKPDLKGLEKVISYADELKQLEEYFQNIKTSGSKDYFLNIVEKIPAGISIVDRRMRVLYMNPEQQKMSELEFQERNSILGGVCFEVFANGSDAICRDCPVQELFNGQQVKETTIHMRKGGYHGITTLPFLVAPNGEILAAIKVGIDLTDREEFKTFSEGLHGKLKLSERIQMILMATMSRGYKRARMLLMTDSGQYVESYRIHRGNTLDDFQGKIEPITASEPLNETLGSKVPGIFNSLGLPEGPCWELTDDGRPIPAGFQYGLVPMMHADKAWGAIYVDNYESPHQDQDITRKPITLELNKLANLTSFANEAARAILEGTRMDRARQAIELLVQDRQIFETQMEGKGLFEELLENCITMIKGLFTNRVVPRPPPEIFGHVMLEDGNKLIRVTRKAEIDAAFAREWHLTHDFTVPCVVAFNRNEEICHNYLPNVENWGKFIRTMAQTPSIPPSLIKKLNSLMSLISVPLTKAGGSVVGVLSLQSPSLNTFNDAAVEMVRAFVQRTGKAVEAHLNNQSAQRFSEIARALVEAKVLVEQKDKLRMVHSLLSGLTHGEGFGFNRAIFYNREGDCLKPSYAIGPRNREEGAHLYKKYQSGQGLPPLRRIVDGEARFDDVPKGLPNLPITSLPKEALRVIKGADSIPEAAFGILDVGFIVFLPITLGSELVAGVLLDNFITGKQPSDEELDWLNAYGSSYSTLFRTHGVVGQLEEEAKKRTELLHVLAHRLRTDLSGPNELIKRAIRDSKPLDQHQLALITEKMWDTHFVINDLLRFSSIESDKLKQNAKFQRVDFAKLVRAAMDELRPEGTNRFDLFLSEGLIVDADEEMLQHAILNLLDNAFRYSPTNTRIEVRLGTDPEHSRSTRLQIVNLPRVSMKDEKWEHLFDKFYRGTNMKFAKGTGLGLYIVAHIIEAHKGVRRALLLDDNRVSFEIDIPLARVQTREDQ